MFHLGDLPTKILWLSLVLLTKANVTSYHGISLVNSLWKIISCIIDTWLKKGIQFHDALHKFWKAWSTGAALLEEKLAQQLPVAKQAPLYSMFLDL